MYGSTWSSGFQLAICDLWYLWIYMPHCRRPRRITQKSSSIISNCLYIHLSLMILTLNHDVCCFWPGIYPPIFSRACCLGGPLPAFLRTSTEAEEDLDGIYVYIYIYIHIVGIAIINHQFLMVGIPPIDGDDRGMVYYCHTNIIFPISECNM